MGVRSTTSCSQFGHREFELEVGDLGDELTTSLVRYLEGAVSRGTRFEPGQTIQFGFQFLEVRDAHDDHLTLYAPERSLASAILATLRQKFVADSFGLSDRLDFPSPRDEALECTRVRALGHGAFVREEGGWRAYCFDDRHDHDAIAELNPQSVYELTVAHPLLDLFVGMPIGTTIHFDRRGVRTVIVDDVELTPESGSFVAALAKREGWPLVGERQAS
jgi:hypothetical protein